MTSAEWMACSDPPPMLEFLRGKVSERKLRLFSTACFLRLTALLPDPRQRQGISVLEQLAEGVILQSECRNVTAEIRRAIPPRDEQVVSQIPTDDFHFVALMLYREFCSSSVASHAISATAGLADGAEEQRHQAQLMRDIIGNPFRPVTTDPTWLTTDVVALATGIYEDRAFDRMPILADALQDAGCDNDDILNHCRNANQVHVRGCWVVDLVLGKE